MNTEAMDISAPTELGFHVIAKPIGPICNLACAYCFYRGKESLYPQSRTWRMSEQTLERYTEQYLTAQPPSVTDIDVAWQGGEPTLLGIEFFEQALKFQAKHTPSGKRCHNSFQTNGTLLDDKWCEFLKKHDFLVGLSIDGPADLHDKFRQDRQGKGSFEQVFRGMKCLQKHGVAFNVLTVVNRHNGSYPGQVYQFLRDNGVEFIQFIPIVERVESVADSQPDSLGDSENIDSDKWVSERSVRPRQFGEFLIGVFDEWLHHDVGRVFVSIFDQALSAWVGIEPNLCVFQKQCGRAMVIEHNGDLYSCDHFVEPAYRLGNIHETPIAKLVNDQRQLRFGQDKENLLPQCCRRCHVRFICNGECPKNRFVAVPGEQAALNYLCEGYKKFFVYIDPYMQAMAQELQSKRPAANVMHRLNAEQQQPGVGRDQPASRVRRNDPCPCGSGKKFKKCCLRE